MPQAKKSRYDASGQAITHQADRLQTLRQNRPVTDATAVLSAVMGMTGQQAQELLRMAGGMHELAQLSEVVLQTLPILANDGQDKFTP